MAKYLISFPSAAMVVPDDEWETVGRDAHAVIDEKAAGVYIVAGGIDEVNLHHDVLGTKIRRRC